MDGDSVTRWSTTGIDEPGVHRRAVIGHDAVRVASRAVALVCDGDPVEAAKEGTYTVGNAKH